MTVRSILLATLLGLSIVSVAPAQAETSIRISLKDRYLTLLDDGKEIGKYPVAIGAPESPTREGSYAVTKMDPQPVYHKKGKVIAPGLITLWVFVMWLTCRSEGMNTPSTARLGPAG